MELKDTIPFEFSFSKKNSVHLQTGDEMCWINHPDFTIGFLAYDKTTRGNRSRTHQLDVLKNDGRIAHFMRITKKGGNWLADDIVHMLDWVCLNITYRGDIIKNHHIYKRAHIGDNAKPTWLIVYPK